MILFYVSGHGFGHATRTAAIIEALLARRPRLQIAVRTQAPGWIFGDRVRHEPASIDPRIAEDSSALRVDAAASAASVREFASRLDQVVEREAAWIRNNGVRVIYADIPFVAGFVGREAGVPVIAASNFLWNWILDGEPGIEVIADGYRLCTLGLRYPLSHDEGWDIFPRSEQVPLVTPLSRRDRREIRAELGLADERRPVVLVGGRATVDAAAVDDLHQFVFLQNDSLSNFHDLIRATDAVVTKAGYSIVAECIAEGKPVLYPPRSGFREEGMLIAAAERLTPMVPISEEDWREGRWGDGLRRLLRMPPPRDRIDTHGAETCAEILIRHLSE